jgi:hypothetical protein
MQNVPRKAVQGKRIRWGSCVAAASPPPVVSITAVAGDGDATVVVFRFALGDGGDMVPRGSVEEA